MPRNFKHIRGGGVAAVGYTLNIKQLGIILYYSYNIHHSRCLQQKKERKLELQRIPELKQGQRIQVVTIQIYFQLLFLKQL